jgi:hypothetical protein
MEASALYGGEWSALGLDHALPPEKGTPVLIGQKAGWAQETVIYMHCVQN